MILVSFVRRGYKVKTRDSHRTSGSLSPASFSSAGTTFLAASSCPSASVDTVTAITSSALATLKRMLGMGSATRFKAVSRTESRMVGRSRTGVMVCETRR